MKTFSHSIVILNANVWLLFLSLAAWSSTSLALRVRDVSRSNCSQLDWKYTAVTKAKLLHGDVCSQSLLDNQCTKESDFVHAMSLCQQAGARLCTATELLNSVAKGSGCGLDGVSSWSSTTCGDLVLGDLDSLTLSSAHDNDEQSLSCDPVSTLRGVRCCADRVVDTFDGTSTSSTSSSSTTSTTSSTSQTTTTEADVATTTLEPVAESPTHLPTSLPSPAPSISSPSAQPTPTPTASPISTTSIAPSTSSPTPTPTTLPSTSTTLSEILSSIITVTPVPLTSIPQMQCPDTCGAVEKGGGTCKGNGRCTSCNTNKVKFGGKCALSIVCKGNVVEFGGFKDDTCSCNNKFCNYCKRESTGDTCKKCREGYYLLDNDCFKTCPPEYALSGLKLVGRRCRKPFLCKANKPITGDDDFPCKCAAPGNNPGSNCHTCEHNAGEHGEKCLKCSDNKLLNPITHTCGDDCNDLDGHIEYNAGFYGSACRLPFNCSNFLDDNDEKCKCNKKVVGRTCLSCEWGHEGNVCYLCGSRTYLQHGKCVEVCEEGLVKFGAGSTGRACV